MSKVAQKEYQYNIWQMEEHDVSLKEQKIIKRRVIRHGRIARISVNKNCPKFILGYCWYLFQRDIIELADPEDALFLAASLQKTQEWMDDGFRDTLNLAHLNILFGVSASSEQRRRNYSNSKALYRLLSRKALQMVLQNTKIQKPLSYLICLEKLTARLANPQLMGKLQFK